MEERSVLSPCPYSMENTGDLDQTTSLWCGGTGSHSGVCSRKSEKAVDTVMVDDPVQYNHESEQRTVGQERQMVIVICPENVEMSDATEGDSDGKCGFGNTVSRSRISGFQGVCSFDYRPLEKQFTQPPTVQVSVHPPTVITESLHGLRYLPIRTSQNLSVSMQSCACLGRKEAVSFLPRFLLYFGHIFCNSITKT